LLSLTLLVGLSAPANALEIFGNTGLGNNGLNLGVDYTRLAQGFTVGSTGYNLQWASIGFQFTTTVPNTSQLLIRLFSNNGSNEPGTLLGSFNSSVSDPALTANSDKVYTFTSFTGTTTLAANTSYWLVVERILGAPQYKWYYASGGQTDTPTVKNSSGVSYFGTKGFANGGSAWTDLSASFSGLRYSIVVVPEPSTYALGAVSTLVMGSLARRRARKAANA
jgi:hypothetical protein